MQGLQRTSLPVVLPVQQAKTQQRAVGRISCAAQSGQQQPSSRRQLLEAAILTAGVGLLPSNVAQAAGAKLFDQLSGRYLKMYVDRHFPQGPVTDADAEGLKSFKPGKAATPVSHGNGFHSCSC